MGFKSHFYGLIQITSFISDKSKYCPIRFRETRFSFPRRVTCNVCFKIKGKIRLKTPIIYQNRWIYGATGAVKMQNSVVRGPSQRACVMQSWLVPMAGNLPFQRKVINNAINYSHCTLKFPPFNRIQGLEKSRWIVNYLKTPLKE